MSSAPASRHCVILRTNLRRFGMFLLLRCGDMCIHSTVSASPFLAEPFMSDDGTVRNRYRKFLYDNSVASVRYYEGLNI